MSGNNHYSKVITPILILFATALLFANSWVYAGQGKWASSGPYAKSVYAIAVDPRLPARVYAGTFGGGVYLQHYCFCRRFIIFMCN